MAKRGTRRLAMRVPPILVIMAKAPVCGAVKSRLAGKIGAVAATALARTLTEALLREAGGDARFRTVLAITPDAALRARFTSWRATRVEVAAPHPTPGKPAATLSRNGRGLFRASRVRGDAVYSGRIGQGRGGLGQRMQRIFDACGQGPLIIVGTDIPFVSRGMIAEAFHRLRGADAVFGRAEDGGYWLVGLRRRPKRLTPFEDVRWSSPHALADTLKNLAGHRIAFAATLFDIDTEADYRRYRSAAPAPAALSAP